MVDRPDAGRTGVTAGRVVGVLLAALAIQHALARRGSLYGDASLALGPLALDPALVRPVLFWSTLALVVTARYAFAYIIGSLLGVVYEELGRPPWPVLVPMAGVVGAGDGLLVRAGPAVLDPGSTLPSLLAWLCYVPAFVWLESRAARAGTAEDGEEPDRTDPTRLE